MGSTQPQLSRSGPHGTRVLAAGLTAVWVAAVLPIGGASAQPAIGAGQPPGMRYVPDVVEQFAELAVRGEGLGFSLDGDVPEPDQCRHFQGMARSHQDGEAPYLFVTKSGNRPDSIVCDLRDCTDGFGCKVGDDVGSLLVVRMESRGAHGERMRSNRLVRGSNVNDGTPPDARDANVATIHFQDPWPGYTHPGGVQLLGDMLVVPLETPHQRQRSGEPDRLH